MKVSEGAAHGYWQLRRLCIYQYRYSRRESWARRNVLDAYVLPYVNNTFPRWDVNGTLGIVTSRLSAQNNIDPSYELVYLDTLHRAWF